MEYPLFEPIYIGTHGFVKLDSVFGVEHDIIRAARVSYGAENENRDPSLNRHLLRYLLRHRHTSPFEQIELRWIIQCPMDVWRQWIRHRTANVNEYSTRYMSAIDATAQTDSDAWRKQSDSSKQGSSDEYVDVSMGSLLTEAETNLHARARHVYEQRLAFGVAREQARKDLPLSTYTRAFWKIDLHNLLHFLSLRLDPHAQLEIRLFAEALSLAVRECFPWTWEAFEDYRLNAMWLSRMEIIAISHQLHHRFITDGLSDDSLTQMGMSSREIKEFRAKVVRLAEAYLDEED